MKCLARNKVKFWYCLYLGTDEVRDENGYRTGEKRVRYSEPNEVMGNISAAKGEAQAEQFGISEQYDKVIVLENPKFLMDENSVLFVDKDPKFDDYGLPEYDYTVYRVARTLNSVAYAIKKVNVS